MYQVSVSATYYTLYIYYNVSFFGLLCPHRRNNKLLLRLYYTNVQIIIHIHNSFIHWIPVITRNCAARVLAEYIKARHFFLYIMKLLVLFFNIS